MRNSDSDGQDQVAPETCESLSVGLDVPVPADGLPGYFWRFAANLASDRKRRRPVHERFVGVKRVPESHQRLAIVERAINELPARCMQAFNLRVITGLPLEEVGRRMGMSERMTKIYIARALEYLQDCLDAVEDSKR